MTTTEYLIRYKRPDMREWRQMARTFTARLTAEGYARSMLGAHANDGTKVRIVQVKTTKRMVLAFTMGSKA